MIPREKAEFNNCSIYYSPTSPPQQYGENAGHRKIVLDTSGQKSGKETIHAKFIFLEKNRRSKTIDSFLKMSPEATSVSRHCRAFSCTALSSPPLGVIPLCTVI